MSDLSDEEVLSAAEDSKLDTILKEIKAVKKDTVEIKKSVKFAEELAEESKKMSEENKKSIGKIKQRCESLETENKQLSKRLIDMESQSRRSNLKFFGVRKDDDEDLLQWFHNFLQDPLDIENPEQLYIERIHKIGKSDVIIVKFLSFRDRQKVWGRRKLLKGTQITMSEDFPIEIESRRKRLYPVMKQARAKKQKAFMVVDKLYINNAVFTVDTIDQVPEPLQVASTNVVKEGNYTFFFGKDTPLSNFYPAPFYLDGRHFNCSEQYIQWRKAQMFKDVEAAEEILKVDDPVKQKDLGKKVKNFEKEVWERDCPEALTRGLLQKFLTNPACKQFLKETENTTLAECNKHDRLFGIGLPLSSGEKGNVASWKGQNYLGKMLMDVRSKV